MTNKTPIEKYEQSFRASQGERSNRSEFYDLFKDSPIPGEHIMGQLGLYMNRMHMSHFLFMHEIYQHILNVHGVVMEFGPRWGQNLTWMQNFRGIYEPFNHNRKIIGFDTFAGFPDVDTDKDGKGKLVKKETFTVTEGYEEHLEKVMAYHEKESPISHLKKYEIVKGDVMDTLPAYLDRHPETVVALAYFDLDIYHPTKKCLELIRSRITKGTVIGFDEVNYGEFPGETRALQEVFGLDKYRLRRSPMSGTSSYIIIE